MRLNFKLANNLLLVLIILIDGYIVLAPLLPSLLDNPVHNKAKVSALEKTVIKNSSLSSSGHLNQPNQVIIPSMLEDQPILEGSIANQYSVLNHGIWRWPNGSVPSLGGNTILIGHRFTYTNPRGVFYFLNDLSLGDNIEVIWSDKAYVYKVVSVNQVSPNDTAIENRSNTPELTLFTCAPLLLPKDRLVVVAELESK